VAGMREEVRALEREVEHLKEPRSPVQ